MTVEKAEILRQENMEAHGFGPNAMKQMKVCGVCGVTSSAEEAVCVSCGSALPEETAFQQYQKRHLYCGNCDTVVSENTKFCPQCGTRLIKA